MKATALIVSLALALAACGRTGDAPDLVDVQRADLVVSVEVTGDLQAVDSTDLKPPTLRETSNFKLASLAAEGSEVKPGDPIATFDPDELNRALEGARSDAAEAQQRLAKRREEVGLARREDALRLMEAESSAKKAALKAEMPAELLASIDARSQQLDNELAQMNLAQTKSSTVLSASSDAADLADYAESQASALRRITSLQSSLAQLSVVAPRAGTVVYPPTSSTEKRKIGDSVYVSDTIVQIVGLDSMIGIGLVDEVEVGRIAAAQPVTLRLDALPDVELHGTLSAITSTVQARSGADPSKVVRVKLAIAPMRGAGLRPGMRFRGRIETLRLPSTIQIPADAVFLAADHPVAYREVDGRLERVELQLGHHAGEMIEVTSGLSAGDRVSRVEPGREAP